MNKDIPFGTHPAQADELARPALAVPAEPWSAPDSDRLFSPQFIVLLAIQHTFGFAFSVFFLLPKYLATELAAGPRAIGQVTAVAMVAGVLIVPLLGPLIDRGRRRRLIIFGTLAMAAGSLGFVWVDSIGPYVMGLRVLHGIAFTVVFNAIATLITDLSPPHRLGRAIGWFGVAMLATNAIAPMVAEPLADAYGWAPVFVIGACAALLATGLALLIRETPPEQRERTRGASALRSARTLMIFAVGAVAGAALGTMFTFTQPFALSLGITRVSGFFAGFTLAAVFMRVGLGGLVDRFGRQRVSVVTLVGYAVVVAAAAGLQPGLLMLLGGAFGLTHGLLYPALTALVIESVESGQRGTVITYFNGAFNAGVGFSVAVLGVVAEAHGYPPIFVGVGVVTLLAAIALALVPR